MTRHNHQTRRAIVRLRLEMLSMLAPAITPLHSALIADGFAIQASSAMHLAQNGTMTARLVYRPSSKAERVQSIVITVRNIVFDRLAAETRNRMGVLTHGY